MDLAQFLNTGSGKNNKETAWNYALVRKNFPKFFPKKAESCGILKVSESNYLKMLSTEAEKKTPRKVLQLKRAELASLYREAKTDQQKNILLQTAEQFFLNFVSETKPEKSKLLGWLLKEE